MRCCPVSTAGGSIYPSSGTIAGDSTPRVKSTPSPFCSIYLLLPPPSHTPPPSSSTHLHSTHFNGWINQQSPSPPQPQNLRPSQGARVRHPGPFRPFDHQRFPRSNRLHFGWLIAAYSRIPAQILRLAWLIYDAGQRRAELWNPSLDIVASPAPQRPHRNNAHNAIKYWARIDDDEWDYCNSLIICIQWLKTDDWLVRQKKTWPEYRTETGGKWNETAWRATEAKGAGEVTVIKRRDKGG